jgi:L,D-transpeptidase YcbB
MGIAQREVSVAGTLCRLMSAGLVGLSLGIAPAAAAPGDVPVTANAGMGTGDNGPSDASSSVARATGGIDGAGNSAVPLTTPLTPAAVAPAAPASVSRAAAPTPVAAPVRGGVDSAGDGPAPAAAQANPAPVAPPSRLRPRPQRPFPRRSPSSPPTRSRR